MRRFRTTFAAAVAVALLAGALYAPVRNFDFVAFDDDVTVYDNPAVRSGLSAGTLRWSLTSLDASNWQPVAWWSHLLDVTLFGVDPGAHHLVSALWHAANAALLLLVLCAFTGRLWPALLAAALWAVHPLHVESVTWIAERKDVVSTALLLATLLLYVRYARRPGAWRLGAVALALALGLMAKPMLVTLPAALLILDWWPLGRWRNAGAPRAWKLLLEKVPLASLSVASAAVTYIAQRGGGAVTPLAAGALGERLERAGVAVGWYVGKTIWPSKLAVPYPIPAGGPPVSSVLAGIGALAVLSAAALLLRRRAPSFGAGWLWFLLTLLPVSGIVQVGNQAMADRFTYVPHLGLFLGLVWSGRELLRGFSPRAAVVAAAMAWLLLLPLAVTASRQLGHWRDSATLFGRALAVTSDNAVAQVNFGLVLAREGRWDDAASHYREALRIAPGDGYAHYNLGVVAATLGRPREALAAYDRALQFLDRPGEIAEVHNSAGLLHAGEGRIDEALAAYRRAMEALPSHPHAKRNTALALLGAGRTFEAAGYLRDLAAASPRDHVVLNDLGYALLLLGRHREAEPPLRRAIAMEPGLARPRYNLASALEGQGRNAEAREMLREARALEAAERPAAGK